MKASNVILFATHFIKDTFRNKAIYAMLFMFLLLGGYALTNGVAKYTGHTTMVKEHQRMARQSWEANPDKHPHRMAHFGTFAFRMKHPLSVFDGGVESFVGNAVFLEAHKQNSVNFSDAGFSSGILRFGELGLAMLLQVILPLIVFFLGFYTVVAERQQGTLIISLSQGARWSEIICGKIMGLFYTTLLFFIPLMLGLLVFLLTEDGTGLPADTWPRFTGLLLGYVLFYLLLSTVTIMVSTWAQSVKNALLFLLGLWLVMVVLVPKSTQALGAYVYPSPSKLSFQSAIEEDVLKKGDSHNPNDPYFNRLKDSVLEVHGVTSVTELPFNYGGFVMREGERTTAQLYQKHYGKLLGLFQKQNHFSAYASLLNPFLALKQLSMALSGSNFTSYIDFQNQAEAYRYQLAQEMNELQMEYISAEKISGSEGKEHVVGHEHWEAFPDFEHRPQDLKAALGEASFSIIGLLSWLLALGLGIRHLSKTAKAL